ncbi:MAG: phosphatase PAP2 family protein [Thermoleophilia bacterium]|nr:phosphatase PAP2 family protein [Thermoleophilia bacterium]
MSILSAATPVFAVPTGVDRLGFPSYRPLPGGVPNPPNAWVEANELNMVRTLNARAQQNPQALKFTEYISEHGAFGIWMDFAKQYRKTAGFVRGWLGTGVMLAAMGSAALKTTIAKRGYDRLRPFQIDPSIHPLGKIPKDASFPSGHTSAAYAAATALSTLWPARAQEFGWWARQTGLSRVHAGVHFPSDVQMGAQVGIQSGLAATSFLR